MLEIGLVGLGGMGTVHYMNFKHIKNVKVVAVVGTTRSDKEKAKLWNLPIYQSISDMCINHNVDVIDICTPTFLHYEHITESLLNDKTVICEKPMTLSSKKAKELFSLAEKRDKKIYVGHVVQFMKQTEVLRDIVKDGTFGKPLDAVFERLSAKPNWGSDSWMFDKEKAGLIPFDLHIHDLDLIISLFGKPKKIQTFKTQSLLKFPEHYRFLYEYDNLNVVGEAAWFNAQIPFTARWRIYFEKGYLDNDGKQLIAYPESGDPIIYDVEEKHKIETGINVPPTEMYLNELKHFVDCIIKDIYSPYISKKQIIETIEILETIST